LKTLILYFTGTGNSLMVAKTVAEALGDAELLHFSKVHDSRSKEPIDTLGLVFPVYWGGLPHIVLDSISALKEAECRDLSEDAFELHPWI
jgi:flavodoxin